MKSGTYKRRWMGVVTLISVVVLALAACAAPAPPVAQQSVGSVRTIEEPTPEAAEAPAEESADTSVAATTEEEAEASPLTRGGVDMSQNPDAVMARISERAAAQAAEDAKVSPDQVLVRVIERVEWNDASLGCPKPGQMYAQVITPGYRIVVEAGDQVIEYHTNTNPEGPLVRCDRR
ncbi:MAG: hypothetical protein D6790_18925 [Caldilineae bacterium]|nr:MAG: hypothetical protein D6790_18925 [Caldilineae bacterium]